MRERRSSEFVIPSGVEGSGQDGRSKENSSACGACCVESSGEVFAQVAKLRIRRANQCEFLFAAPALELLLAAYGIPHVAKGLEMDQAENFVLLREARGELLFMFRDAAFEMICDATSDRRSAD